MGKLSGAISAVLRALWPRTAHPADTAPRFDTDAQAGNSMAELHAGDFLAWAWAWADDAHPDDLGELHRRALRDRARQALDRDAAEIARGLRRRAADIEWAAQQLPTDHPRRAAVRALAARTGVPLEYVPLRERAASLRAEREHAAREQTALITASVPLALREAHTGAAIAALRAAVIQRVTRAPRAPAPVRLA